jgi:hypothetical protein
MRGKENITPPICGLLVVSYGLLWLSLSGIISGGDPWLFCLLPLDLLLPPGGLVRRDIIVSAPDRLTVIVLHYAPNKASLCIFRLFCLFNLLICGVLANYFFMHGFGCFGSRIAACD